MIAEVVRGAAPTLIEADKANELINVVNGIMKSTAANPLRLSVDGDGKMNLSINLSPIGGYIVINGVPTPAVVFTQSEVEEEEGI